MYALKPWFVRRLRRVEDVLVARRVSANALTLAAVIVTVATGVLIGLGGLTNRPALWFAVPPLVLIRLGLNAMDGSVARRTRTARPFGAALNEIGDRASDAALIGATGLVVSPALALGATGAAFLASSTGVLSLALTGKRDCGGPMGKADRGLVLSIGALAGALLGAALPWTIAVALVCAGSLATVVARLSRLRRELGARRSLQIVETLYVLPTPPRIEEEMLHAVGR